MQFGHFIYARAQQISSLKLVRQNYELPLSDYGQIWCTRQMYITGGVGARHEGEAFGKPYELPNARAYAESCAAIANVMWNWRMLQLEGNPICRFNGMDII